MKLKITGDGTLTGTDLFNEYDEKIAGVSSLKFKLNPTTGNLATAYFEIEADDMDFDITPGQRYNATPFPAAIGSGRTKVILKLAGDGSASGTVILDSEADTPIHGITKIVWKNGVVRIWIIDVEIKLTQTSATATAASVASPSPSYSSGPGNPNYQTPPPDPLDAPRQLHLDFDSGNTEQACNHAWVNASFVGLKMVCKHCNAEKP